MSDPAAPAPTTPASALAGVPAALAWSCVLFVALAAAACDRLVAIGAHVRWTLPSIIVLAGISLVAERVSWSALGERIRAVWPVVTLVAVDLIVRAGTALRYSPSAGARLGYFAAAGVAVVALLAVVQLGHFCESFAPKSVAPLFAIVVGSTLVVGLTEFAAFAGLLDHAPRVLTWWDATLRAQGIGIWSPEFGEGFRANALCLNPNATGALGVACLVVAAAVDSFPRGYRATLAAGSVGIVLLSGSRTSLITLLVVAVALVLMRAGRRRNRGAHASALAATISRVASIALIGIATFAAITSVRVRESLTHLGHGDSSLARTLDEMLGARVTIWRAAWQAWIEAPAGRFSLPEPAVGLSIHNEYLERLVWGGPLMLAALLVMLFWLVGTFRPRGGELFGPALAIAWALTAVTMAPTHSLGFSLTAMFAIGALVAHDRSAHGSQSSC